LTVFLGFGDLLGDLLILVAKKAREEREEREYACRTDDCSGVCITSRQHLKIEGRSIGIGMEVEVEMEVVAMAN